MRLGELPDNEIPPEGATEVARQGLELSTTKRVAKSKPHPLATEEDDDDNIELIEHQGEDSTQPEFQAGPSTPTVPTLDVDTEFQADPGPVLPTVHGLASVNESMVTSLSSITNLSEVSNTTATNIEIATEVSGYIQGALHCQQHIS